MTSTLTPPINLLENPKLKEFIENFKCITQTCETVSIEEGRRQCTQFFLSKNTIYEPIYRIENLKILGKDGNKIPVRLYIPSASKRLTTLLYFHRGGWVFGNINEADPVCRKLANHLGCIVVSVEYRLAPENPFPRPLNDCYAATEWSFTNINYFGGDGSTLIVCGESAGGNLAAAVALMARDKKGPPISAQLLICPMISSLIKEEAYEKSADHYFLTQEAMRFFWNMYLLSTNENLAYASLDQIRDFTDLPPALIVTAEYDPLRIEAESYANKLQNAQIGVLYKCFPRVIHGFIDLPIYEEEQKVLWIREIGTLLKELKSL